MTALVMPSSWPTPRLRASEPSCSRLTSWRPSSTRSGGYAKSFAASAQEWSSWREESIDRDALYAIVPAQKRRGLGMAFGKDELPHGDEYPLISVDVAMYCLLQVDLCIRWRSSSAFELRTLTHALPEVHGITDDGKNEAECCQQAPAIEGNRECVGRSGLAQTEQGVAPPHRQHRFDPPTSGR